MNYSGKRRHRKGLQQIFRLGRVNLRTSQIWTISANFKMHPLDCPSWEYAQHPNRARLPTHVSRILVALASGATDTSSIAADTRPAHREIFTDVTPAGYGYFSGFSRANLFRGFFSYKIIFVGLP